MSTSRATLVLPLLLAACSTGPEETGATVPSAGGKADGGLPEEFRRYDVLFTNPVCAGAAYDLPIPTVDGQSQRTGKPANVFCTQADHAASAARPASPQFQLIRWIDQAQAGDELFLAYLSYSNAAVHERLCAAAGRGVKITFVNAGSSRNAQLEACELPGQDNVRTILRGETGGIGYAHNKIFLFNPAGASEVDSAADAPYLRMVFSSGNMSSGIVTHHENWHFIEVSRDTYFAEAHRCLYELQTGDNGTPADPSDDPASLKARYQTAMDACLAAAAAEFPPSDDIQVFFIPNSGHHRKLRTLMAQAIQQASEIDLAAHRFGAAYKGFSEGGVLSQGFQNDLRARVASSEPVAMRMVADDDLYWLAPAGEAAGQTFQTGANVAFESDNVAALEAAGGDQFEIRYLETNNKAHMLHHNKFMVIRGRADGVADSVVCGAANFTGTGYGSSGSGDPNFENIYWIQIPAVVEQFTRQMDRFWGEQQAGDVQAPPAATPVSQMPTRLPEMDQ